jgi:hypothetical protein
MSMLAVKVRTALALGAPNLVRFLGYRTGVKVGMNPVRRIHATIPPGVFFSDVLTGTAVQRVAPRQWFDGHRYFGWYQVSATSVPNWHENPFIGSAVKQPTCPWWLIPDFDAAVGDIKTVWEASRFDWVLTFAQHAVNGEPGAMARLNAWLADWVRCNPPYCGPNWKCGQEASIRVMHLAIAALLLGQHRQTSMPLRALIKAHLKRIAPTIQYAISQDNNHGTSEATALFIGGSWLATLGDSAGDKWQQIGRRWLENRAARLIEEDGSFSQYSVTYHRVMLDTYCMAEHWRRCLGLPTFSKSLYRQLAAATHWLYQMTQTEAGDAPNLGANDGARLLPLSDTDYRDFRPSVQLAMALFCERCAYAGDGSWNLQLHWLGIAVPGRAAAPACSAQFAQGGYSVLRNGKYFALLHFPRFRFRPSQADALHVDLWSAGQNFLRDAGTYSYNAGDEVTRYFGGTAGHNTVQFDERDQMPRLSRFLFGDWLKAEAVVPIEETADAVTAAAGYIDGKGAAHHRKLSLSDQGLRVEDTVSGFKQKAVLRWRLLPTDWRLDGDTVRSGSHMLHVTASVPIARMTLTQGWESRYYLKKESVPVLEVEIHQPGRLVTEYQFLT